MSIIIKCEYEENQWEIDLVGFKDFGTHYYIAYEYDNDLTEIYFGHAIEGWFIAVPDWCITIMIQSVYDKDANIMLIDKILDQKIDSASIAFAIREYSDIRGIDESVYGVPY